MARAPFNVLVYPFRRGPTGVIEYAVLKRADEGWWQGVSGGGEDGESASETARRETSEETGIPASAEFIQLDTVEPIPASAYRDSPAWGETRYVIPQYNFGCDAGSSTIIVSPEHDEFRWVTYEAACEILRYNHLPLWELNARLLGLGPRDAPRPG